MPSLATLRVCALAPSAPCALYSFGLACRRFSPICFFIPHMLCSFCMSATPIPPPLLDSRAAPLRCLSVTPSSGHLFLLSPHAHADPFDLTIRSCLVVSLIRVFVLAFPITFFTVLHAPFPSFLYIVALTYEIDCRRLFLLGLATNSRPAPLIASVLVHSTRRALAVCRAARARGLPCCSGY